MAILTRLAAGAAIVGALTAASSGLGDTVARADPLLPCPQVARCDSGQGGQPLGTPDSPEAISSMSGGQPLSMPGSPEAVSGLSGGQPLSTPDSPHHVQPPKR